MYPIVNIVVAYDVSGPKQTKKKPKLENVSRLSVDMFLCTLYVYQLNNEIQITDIFVHVSTVPRTNIDII